MKCFFNDLIDMLETRKYLYSGGLENLEGRPNKFGAPKRGVINVSNIGNTVGGGQNWEYKKF